jgi:enterobactin synthetase component D
MGRILMSFLSHCNPIWSFPRISRAPLAVEASFDWRCFQTADFNAHKMPMPPPLSHAVAKRKAEFLAGRLCARLALKLAGTTPTDVGYNDDRSPEWPVGMVGSVTHTDRVAGAVVGRETDYLGLGVDFEYQIEAVRAREIADSILTDADKSLKMALPDISFEHYLTLVFSLKEGLYKALYPKTKIFMGFHDAEIATLGDGDARLRLTKPMSEDFAAGLEFDAVYSYTGDLFKTLVYIRA